MSRRLLPVVGLVLAALVAASRIVPLGLGLRTGFVLASAAPAGNVLLSAIARLTGAGWPADPRGPGSLTWLAVLGAVAMLTATGAAIPSHLVQWSWAPAVALRAFVAMLALVWAGRRLAAGAGPTFAAVTLAAYAWLVTPLAADWLLAAAPGHPVSAIGMMLFLLHFAAGCATTLVRSAGRIRRDLALLLVAAMLGLCYLVFMDYLIVWYGNLPARVPFYLDRSGRVAATALLIGLVGPIACVASGRNVWAAASALAGLFLFAWWWIGGGVISGVVALAVAAAALPWERARG